MIMKRFAGTFILMVLFSSLLVTFPATGQGTVGLADTPWPMYQHDAQHTGRSPFVGIMHQPVLLWEESLGLSWLMGGMTIDQHGNLLIADGMKLTRYDPIQRQPIWQFLYTHSWSIPLLASDGYMYLGMWNVFFQLTPDGQLGWISQELSPNIAFGSSASFGVDGNVYVGHDALWSFTQKGDISWVYPFDDFSNVSPAVGLDGTIYAGGGSIYDLCAWRSNGYQKWCQDTPHVAVQASPSIAANGNIIMASDAGSVYSFHPNGQVEWEFETEWIGTDAQSVEAAIGPDESIYFTINTHEAIDGYLYAIDGDGEFKWRTYIPYNADSNRPAWFYRPPITDRLGNVYICAGNMRCYGIAADGSTLWELEFPIEDSVIITAGMAPLIAEDGLMYIMDSHNLLSAYADPEIYPLLFTDVQIVEHTVAPGTAPFISSLLVDSTIMPQSYSAAVTDVPWLSISPASGETPDELELAFDPSVISIPGIYRAEIQLRSQDRAGWTVVVPVELNVGAVKTFLPMINKETGHYQLIYLSNWYGKGQLVTNEIDGGNRQVILGDVPTYIYGAFFSPDARRMAHFSSYEGTGLTDLSLIDTLTGQTLFQVADLKVDRIPSWDPEGNRFVMAFFRDDPMYADLYIVDLNGAFTRLTSNPYNDQNPLWSPTGEWIAFTNNDTISLVRPDGSDMHALPIDYIREFPVDWSKDGQRLYYFVPPRDPNPSRLWVYDIQTGESEVIVEGSLDVMYTTLPQVSPDGTRIAYFVTSGYYPNRDVRVITLDSGEIVTVSPEAGECQRLSWSPDSQWIAYDCWRQNPEYGVNGYDIYVVRRGGGSPHLLTPNIDWDIYAAWRR